MKRRLLSAWPLGLAIALATQGMVTAGAAEPRQMRAGEASRLVASAMERRGVAPVSGTVIDQRLRGQSGQVDVWVQLDQPSLASTRAALARSTGIQRVRTEGRRESAAIAPSMAAQRASLRAQQQATAQRLAGFGARELGRVKVAHNAIAVRVAASQIPAIAAMPGVLRVKPVIHYALDLAETVPYVGGAAVQAAGFDGSGVKVAVLDSGIDYTHRNLGGAGTLEAYAAAYGAGPGDPLQTSRDGLFPTAKVVAGFDFVGEAWPNGERTEDDDPIDFQGHGSHVADIVAGASLDGTHKGMAPGAGLVAVKVCSAVASSCNGVSLLLGMDYALDPNGDGDLSDAVDVINLSLGASYGQIEDDLTLATANAVDFGVVVVASAGNSADKPFVTGSPSIAPGVIGVAQTAMPSASLIPAVINAPAAIAGVYANTATLDWAPVGSGVTGDIKTALAGGAADNLACVPLPAGSLAGKVALVDRGACAISIKVDNAAKAGATGFLLGLVAPGDAVTFSFGGGDTFVPSLVIQQSLANAIKGQLAAGETVNVSISPAAAIPLAGSMASTSSRGPSYSLGTIKPEIGAPGASLSAQAGTGDVQTPFGGTSGAAPMVAGAAALLVQAYPALAPGQIKAMLMNSAETAVFTNPGVYPGQLAPITRTGAGELRVDRALGLSAIAWSAETLSSALSFGVLEASGRTVVKRTLTVENLGADTKRFNVTPSFRYADDEASGAVRVIARRNLLVPPNSSAELDVTMIIDPTKLPAWTLNGGTNGGNGQLLNGVEVDGYLTLTAGAEKLSVPWHVLPRKAASTTALPLRNDRLLLLNRGLAASDFDLFSLTGTSPQVPPESLPGMGDNFAIIDVKAVGVRYLSAAVAGQDLVEFAISTYGRRAHPNYPAGFEVGLDTNGDGVEDWVVFNTELTGFAATGQNVVAVRPANSSTGTLYFFTDADLSSGNVILTVPMAPIGAVPGAPIGFSVRAFDNYFTGALTDGIAGMSFTPGDAKYGPASGALPFGTVGPRATLTLPYSRAATPAVGSTETGLLLMYRRNAGDEASAITLE